MHSNVKDLMKGRLRYSPKRMVIGFQATAGFPNNVYNFLLVEVILGHFIQLALSTSISVEIYRDFGIHGLLVLLRSCTQDLPFSI